MRKIQPCAYCGRPATTRDHIPPQSFFPEPLRDNLVTVPACEPCHEPFAKDDEYFVLAALAWASEDDETAATVMRRRVPAVLTPRHERLGRRIARQIKREAVRTSSGLLAGVRAVLTPEGARINRVLERIVRGLYWRERKCRVPDEYEVQLMDPGNLSEQPLFSSASQSWRTRGGVFQWKITQGASGSHAICIMRFYRNLLVLGCVMPRALRPPAPTTSRD